MNEKTFPKLSLYAKKLFSLPASSASAERAFSKLKMVVTDSRTLFLPANVSKLIHGHSLIDLEI